MSESAFLSTLIDALAEKAAQDYLTAQATPSNDYSQPGTNPVPLSDMVKAA